jgi:hypothetical protein
MTGFYTLLVRPQLKFFRPNENGLEAQHSRCANRFNRDQSAETANSACRGEPYAKRQKCPQASEEESRASQEESQSSEEIGAGEEESWAGEKSRASEEGQVSEESWAGEKNRASEEDRVSEENSTSEEESWASKESSIARKRRSQSRLNWRMLKHLPARCTHAVPTKQAEAVLGGLVTLTAAI